MAETGFSLRTDGFEPELPKHRDPVRVDLHDLDPRSAMAAHESNQAADRPAAEDRDGVTGLDLRACHVVRGDRQRFDQRGIVITQRVRDLQQPGDGNRQVLLHAAGQIDADHLQPVTEIAGAHAARAASAAEGERLDDHAVTLAECAGRRCGSDFSEDLVPDHASSRHAVIHVPLEDVEVRAADAHAANPQQCLVRSRTRHF